MELRVGNAAYVSGPPVQLALIRSRTAHDRSLRARHARPERRRRLSTQSNPRSEEEVVAEYTPI